MNTIHVLQVEHIRASIEEKQILNDVSLTVRSGEVHVLMGPNGSGKSTLAYALLGHPFYEVPAKGVSIRIDRTKLETLPTEERAKAGLFLAFQSPISVPGVTVLNLLRSAYQQMYAEKTKPSKLEVQNPVLSRRWTAANITLTEFMALVKKFAHLLRIDESLLSRGINDGFSGGEKKKIEMLQALVLNPKFAVFDEIDTGLDVDALKLVAQGIDTLSKNGTGVVIITHYQRILTYVKPDVVHVLVKGNIVKTGTSSLVKTIEQEGYGAFLPKE